MPATYTASLRLTKPAVGDTNWGTTVNSGFTDLTDSAIAGYTTVSMPSNADYTLTSNNGAADESRSMMLNITSAVSLTVTRNIICPTASKLYSIKNSTTGGQAIVLKTSGGTGVTIPNGSTMLLACNGTNVVAAIDYISFSNLAYTGTLTGGTGVVNLGSGQFYKDASGNVGIGTASPAAKLQVVGGQVLLDNGQFYGIKTSGGVNNSVLNLDASNNLLIGAGGATVTAQLWTGGAERARIDISGNLGIGTTSPSTYGGRLNVYGGDVVVADAGTSSGASAPRIGSSSQALVFKTNTGAGSAAEVARFDGSGNLGIGTATPGARLHVAVSGTGSGLGDVISETVGANGNAGYAFRTAGVTRWSINLGGTDGSNALRFYDANASAERMRLDASGNLGIGTASPAAKLDVNGAIRGVVGTATLEAIGAGDLTINASNAAGQIAFRTAGAERARIDSSGNLLVGVTAAISGFSACKLTAVSSAGSYFQVTGGATSTNYAHNTSTTGDNSFLTFGTEAAFTTRGSIDYNRAGGLVRYNTTSDYRAKDIIGPVQDPGATIDALKVYEGVMKGATQSRPMLIAHEAQAHAPYAVSGVKDEVNDDGTPKFQQMDVSSLVPLLLAEIQSLRARVASLEAKP